MIELSLLLTDSELKELESAILTHAVFLQKETKRTVEQGEYISQRSQALKSLTTKYMAAVA